MTKTKLLLAGLLAGAVAFGTACKTDQGSTNTGTDQTTTGTDAGTGGAGDDHPRSRQGVNPVEEGTREMEPGVHEGGAPEHEQPGTGGAGIPVEPTDSRGKADEASGSEPEYPGAPSTHAPIEERGGSRQLDVPEK